VAARRVGRCRVSGHLSDVLTIAGLCGFAAAGVSWLRCWSAVRPVWWWLTVTNALFAMSSWVDGEWVRAGLGSLAVGYCAYQWWHSGGDDDWRRRRRRLWEWARSRIPRPRVVVVRPVEGAA
jgi:hypothetical protein